MKEIFGVFGNNGSGQLGLGDLEDRNIPTKVKDLKDIQQMSLGPHGSHFLVKTSENVIFVTGLNAFYQLGIGNSISTPKFKPMHYDEQISEIWGNVFHSKAKSAKK